MNILLAGILLVNIAGIAIIGVFLYRAARIYNDFVEFITPKGENLPSPAAEVVTAVADEIGKKIAMNFKTTFMGKASADVRAENGVTADIGMDIATSSNPLIATLLKSFPTLRKTLRRNPELISLALEKLGSFNKPGSTPPPTPTGSPPSNGQTSFTLDLRA